MVSDDIIEINLLDKKLFVNQVKIPLAKQSDTNRHNQSGFSLESSCHGALLNARVRDNGTLEVELPLNGFMLDIHSENEIIIKVLMYKFLIVSIISELVVINGKCYDCSKQKICIVASFQVNWHIFLP